MNFLPEKKYGLPSWNFVKKMFCAKKVTKLPDLTVQFCLPLFVLSYTSLPFGFDDILRYIWCILQKGSVNTFSQPIPGYSPVTAVPLSGSTLAIYQTNVMYWCILRVYRDCQAFFPVRIGSSHPFTRKRVLPPLWVQGGRHTSLRWRGAGDPILTKGQALWYSLYTIIPLLVYPTFSLLVSTTTLLL